jgi:hypothetical protein
MPLPRRFRRTNACALIQVGITKPPPHMPLAQMPANRKDQATKRGRLSFHKLSAANIRIIRRLNRKLKKTLPFFQRGVHKSPLRYGFSRTAALYHIDTS